MRRLLAGSFLSLGAFALLVGSGGCGDTAQSGGTMRWNNNAAFDKSATSADPYLTGPAAETKTAAPANATMTAPAPQAKATTTVPPSTRMSTPPATRPTTRMGM
jgi:hypothetical protein